MLLCTLAFPSATKAAPLLFTLSGVTFADNATAQGSFVFDPSTNTYSTFNITTTIGVVSDTFAGSIYNTAAGTKASLSSGLGSESFIFDNFALHSHYLALALGTNVTGPGTYALSPGTPGDGGFGNSGEFVDSNFDYRLIPGGNLVVTATAVTEPATYVLLAVGGCALLLHRRCLR